ncbi:hypothetical protein LCGC14_1589430 [marine sediment metagenome]|uniref:Uncharacterized protein n=1 Tax=marine sediment metagenome TaxID=412755 RepID=A0A0F9IEB7_9ZZZZ
MKATIYVEPYPKGRPRVAMVGKHTIAYTPKKTRISEADIKASIRREIAKAGRFGAGEALVLWVTFFVVRPKNAPKRVRHPVKRPDLDNYLKTLLDALDKFAFPDDSQIVNIHAKKAFAAEGTSPRIVIVLERQE